MFLLKIVLSLLAVYSILAVVSGSGADCTKMATTGDCNFYSECVEKHVPCGEDGYALHYAGKYCKKFGEESTCFTEDGQKWINDVRVCLEVFLLRNSTAYRNNGTCEELQKEGFSSHPRCYVQNGFCKVMLGSFQNLLCLVGKVFDVSDFLSQIAIKQVYDTLQECYNN